ncbi:hypothetical protein MMC22_002757 [Lobaria immixta]|nr:hypothetical protein [Lobaria immixta]
MTSEQAPPSEHQAIEELGPTSYTALRLASPIPEGWLKSHRKSWFTQSRSFSNYSSKAATFSASFSGSHLTQHSGRDGPSANAFNASFPQPEDVNEDETDEDNDPDEIEEGESSKAVRRASNAQDEFSPPAKRSTEKQASGAGKASPSPTALTYFEARSRLDSDARQGNASTIATQSPPTPLVTAPQLSKHTQNPIRDNSDVNIAGEPSNLNKAKASAANSISGGEAGPSPSIFGTNQQSSVAGDSLPPGDSTASLIPHGQKYDSNVRPSVGANSALVLPPVPMSTGMVRFNIPTDGADDRAYTKSELSQSIRRRSWRQLRRGRKHPGEIVKMEKMLVRVDSTMQQLPTDYNENDSLKTESRTVDKWREFVVVCRESTEDDSDFSIQMYKSRVIPAIEQTHLSKRAAHEIPLIPKSTRVNLYSSLDKTLVIWVPWKVGTRIYILRTRSAANAVEWYTFLRSTLGWKRPSNLQVHVPDLNVTLQLEDPFGELEASRAAAETEEVAIVKSLDAERAAANTIIKSCMKALEDSPQWEGVLDTWLKDKKMGLAWKRYDRLEWVHGANEQRMHGTIAMQKSYDLELRPKHHYPTTIKSKNGASTEEPPPVEGFLIRLTSQKGRFKRLGKMFYKRLYFSTHNQFLCYCRPAKALPPPPPKLTLGGGSKIPSAQHIINHTPLIYAIDPYPTTQDEIDWLKHGNASTREKHDQEAYIEAERKVNTLLQAEGYINLSHVVQVQNVRRGSSPADVNMDQGPDVDFHEPVSDTPRDDGKTDQFDDDRTFELVLKNGLIIRLQAYNEQAKKEWMTGIENLVQYWKARLADDMNALKIIRQSNLQTLGIDEEMESELGQFAEKWEVTRAEASPQLFNMCGISCCRAITMSGVLYRKPKRHSTFIRCGVILCHGQLLIYHGTLRERSGREIPHIQHDRQTAISLKDCYIYSGLVTEGDLLYQNQTFDSNHPGHHALPKVYREDGWTSHDEDTMTCFVIWHGQRKSIFRANEDTGTGSTRQRLRYVSRLGVLGRSIVFKARSRAERDHWVLNIGMEIDRLQTKEEIRIQS